MSSTRRRARAATHAGSSSSFSRDRQNVAISRAQCLVLVGSPRLLDMRTRSVDQMRLVNALRQLVEVAKEQAQAEVAAR